MIRLFSHRRFINALKRDSSGQTLLRALNPIRAVIICCAVCTLWPGAGAQPANVSLERDFPILVSRIRTNQPADYVIVVDRSGSMRPFWQLVRQSVASFLEAVPDGDYVSIVEFGTDARNSITPRPMSPQTRADLLREVGNLPEPTDRATDIGRAVEKTLDELNRPNGNRLKFVFFLSDFAHDPTPQSPYYRRQSPQDAVWQRLAGRMTSEQSENIVQSYALLLPLGGAVGRDLPAGRVVFPGLESVNVNQATLLPWFERRKAEIARDKLRAIVERESTRTPITFRSFEQRDDRLVAIFDLITDRVVETSSVTRVQIGDLTIGEELRSRLTPEPTGELNLTIAPGTEQRTMEIPLARVEGQSAFLRWTASDRVSFRLSATQNLEPAGEITRLNLPTSRAFEISVNDASARLSGGWLQWWWLILPAAALAVALLGLRAYYRKEYIIGDITVAPHPPDTLTAARKSQTYEVGNTDDARGRRLAGAKWTLIFQAFQPPHRARGVYVKILGGTATLQRRDEEIALTDQTWERIPGGSIIEVKEGKSVKTVKFD